MVLQTHLPQNHRRRKLRLLASSRRFLSDCSIPCCSFHLQRKQDIAKWTLVPRSRWWYDLVDVGLSRCGNVQFIHTYPISLQGLFLHRLYPHPDDRTLATGVLRLASNAGMVTGSLGSTRLFRSASGFPAGTLGRQIAWLFLAGSAIFTFIIGLTQPKMEGPDPILEAASSRPVDEETSLLEDGERERVNVVE